MDDEQIRRVAVNESRFRAMNERQAADTLAFHGEYAGTVAAMCECAVTECDQQIPFTLEQWNHLRSNPRWFGVRPDHVMTQVESVVEQHDGYWIVEKHPGPGAEVAESTS